MVFTFYKYLARIVDSGIMIFAACRVWRIIGLGDYTDCTPPVITVLSIFNVWILYVYYHAVISAIEPCTRVCAFRVHKQWRNIDSNPIQYNVAHWYKVFWFFFLVTHGRCLYILSTRRVQIIEKSNRCDENIAPHMSTDIQLICRLQLRWLLDFKRNL